MVLIVQRVDCCINSKCWRSVCVCGGVSNTEMTSTSLSTYVRWVVKKNSAVEKTSRGINSYTIVFSDHISGIPNCKTSKRRHSSSSSSSRLLEEREKGNSPCRPATAALPPAAPRSSPRRGWQSYPRWWAWTSGTAATRWSCRTPHRTCPPSVRPFLNTKQHRVQEIVL